MRSSENTGLLLAFLMRLSFCFDWYRAVERIRSASFNCAIVDSLEFSGGLDGVFAVGGVGGGGCFGFVALMIARD